MSAATLLYVSFPDRDVAERTARTVVDERLAACANILGASTSIYRWQGEVADAQESSVLFKTAPGLADALAARIAELHPYQLPVIERWPVEVSGAVAQWITTETQGV